MFFLITLCFSWKVCELVEGPLLLKLDPKHSRPGELGVSIFESVVVGTTDMQLVKLPYTLATEEAERVGVDHVARMAAHQTTERSHGEMLIDFTKNYNYFMYKSLLMRFDCEFAGNWWVFEHLPQISYLILCFSSLYDASYPIKVFLF